MGAGDMLFKTAWSGASTTSIHAYTDPPSIKSVAIATGATRIADITDASIYDPSSRVRTPHLGEIAVWQNRAGYWLATRVERLESRSHGFQADEIVFSYVIAPSKTASFANAT